MLTISYSVKESERVCKLAYEGKIINVMLCNSTEQNYDAETLISTWETTELEGNGYQRYSTTIGAPVLSAVTGYYELPPVMAEFTNTSGPAHIFDRVVAYFQGELYPHSVQSLDPNGLIRRFQLATYEIIIGHGF